MQARVRHIKFQGAALRVTGFTLIELLVSLAVMIVLLTLLMQALITTGSLITFSSRKSEASQQARLVLDAMASDISRRSPQLPIIVRKNGTTSSSSSDAICVMAFNRTSSQFGSGAKVRSGLFAYGIFSSADSSLFVSGPSVPMLNRGEAIYLWDPSLNNTTTFLTAASADLPLSSASSGGSSVTTWNAMAPDIFRLEISFLLSSGNIVQQPPTDVNYSLSAPLYALATPETPTASGAYVRALVIAVAVIDRPARKILSGSDELKLGQELQDPVDGQFPITAWTANLNALLGASTTIYPRKVLQNVRFYQRVILL